MSDLAIDLTVTTPDIGTLDVVSLEDGNARVVSFNPGGIRKRRSWLTSPSVRGGRQQSSQPDQRTLVLRLRIFGTSKANLDTNVAFWLAVFDQTRYHLTLTIDGVGTTWLCDDADVDIVNESGDDGLDKIGLMKANPRGVWEFRIPADPDPTEGVF